MNETTNRKAPRAPGKSFLDMVKAYSGARFPITCSSTNPSGLATKISTWIATSLVRRTTWRKRRSEEGWQMACREEEIPEVGDSIVYDITDISILVVRVSKTEIKAYYNACLHQGRQLRDGPSHNTELRCPFHGFLLDAQRQAGAFSEPVGFPADRQEQIQSARSHGRALGRFRVHQHGSEL